MTRTILRRLAACSAALLMSATPLLPTPMTGTPAAQAAPAARSPYQLAEHAARRLADLARQLPATAKAATAVTAGSTAAGASAAAAAAAAATVATTHRPGGSSGDQRVVISPGRPFLALSRNGERTMTNATARERPILAAAPRDRLFIWHAISEPPRPQHQKLAQQSLMSPPSGHFPVRKCK